MAPQLNTPLYQVRHPAVATRHLCAAAGEFGIEVDDVLRGTQVTPADLADPDLEVSARDEITTARNVLPLIPDATALAVATGLRYSVTNLGLLGFAVLACPTLRDLMATTLRFFTLTSLQVGLHAEEGASTYHVTMTAAHLPPDVRPFFVARDIAGIVSTGRPFLGTTIAKYSDRISLELGADGAHLRSAVALLPIPNVRFDRPVTFVELPVEMLDEELPQADEHTMRMCIAQCEELVARRNERYGMGASVRPLLLADPARMPSLNEVAETLHMHPRTLSRRLAAEGTSWRTLANEVRATLAVELLTHIGLTVEEISDRLGYSETAAFSRAFTRWFGVPPSKYRLTPGRTDG